jgi:formylmethanofuran dehydrogenase subunit E
MNRPIDRPIIAFCEKCGAEITEQKPIVDEDEWKLCIKCWKEKWEEE